MANALLSRGLHEGAPSAMPRLIIPGGYIGDLDYGLIGFIERHILFVSYRSWLNLVSKRHGDRYCNLN